jgi:Tfp pilus assembly protein PilF
MNLSSRSRRVLLLGLFLILAASAAGGYWLWFRSAGHTQALPGPDTPLYQEYLRAFQVGVAAVDVPRFVNLARSKLDSAIKLIPGEPAGWANRGLLNLRNNDLAQAASDLEQAKTLAPDSGEVEALLGYLAEKKGQLPEAVAHFRKALAQDPDDLAALFTLADAVSKEGGPDSEAEYQRLMEQILKVQPNNLKVLIERARVASRRPDMAAFRDTLTRFDRLAPGWTSRSREKLAELHKVADGPPNQVAFHLQILGNVLMGEHGYKRDSLAVKPEAAFVGMPVRQFLRLQRPRPTAAPPDRDMAFAPGPWAAAPPVAGLDKSRWDVLRSVLLLGGDQRDAFMRDAISGGLYSRPVGFLRLAIFLANAREVRRADTDAPALPFPGGPANVPPSAAGVLALDWDNDFRTDLLLAGAGGLRFWQQQSDGSFAEVTAKTGLPADVLNGDYYGAWAADIDMDGDLDIIVARRSGPPLVLRNNRDGTFIAVDAFPSVSAARAFAWADLDNDGAPDAAFVDSAGKLHVFANERAGQFRPWQLPQDVGKFLALTAADINNDGVFDVVALRTDGALMRISDQEKRKSWQVAEVAHWSGGKDLAPGAVELFAEDVDNNGALDLIVAGPQQTQVYLADEQGRFEPLPAAVPLRAFAVIDLDGDGRLDLLGLSPAGQPMQALNRGRKEYHSKALWMVANPKAGDERLNSFAIGGEVEVRSGTLVQKQPINSVAIHFGLGEQRDVDLARIVWPNGVPQWEFELPPFRVIVAAQRLSGSCPFLFTNDGTGMRFAGDFMWSTPLGMYVNGQNQGAFAQTTEWLKIRGDQLVPRDGYYDVRVQANLWETDYFDQLALLVVDHPPDTDIYCDERFFLTPTPPELYVTTPARPVARALDHHGRDATDLVRAIDGRYLDRAGRGRFQGVTAGHWVEADLGDDAPTEGPLYLVARGWIHPTDSSINVAIEQGTHERPRGLVLEVPDGKGGWKVGRPALGFPAGKDKTILVRLDGIEGKGVSRRFRLRTNMEIYWDFLGYARRLDSGLARVQRPPPLTADLRYRGILEMTQRDASSPEVPHYDKVVPGQGWRDLTGFYTRFGDVRELLAKVDDRYVIMNAGDEIALRFPVPEGPPAGWKRDFIWESDGWTRDGNPNTRFGTTVLPLPAHGREANDPPGRLDDDPVYRRFPQDWLTYHTRFVDPDEFARGLRTFRRPGDRR